MFDFCCIFSFLCLCNVFFLYLLIPNAIFLNCFDICTLQLSFQPDPTPSYIFSFRVNCRPVISIPPHYGASFHYFLSIFRHMLCHFPAPACCLYFAPFAFPFPFLAFDSLLFVSIFYSFILFLLPFQQ